jgi:hypothetical protein
MDYYVTYLEPIEIAEITHNSVQALNDAGELSTLEEIVDTCTMLGVCADLYDPTGFRRGWVFANGNYSLS